MEKKIQTIKLEDYADLYHFQSKPEESEIVISYDTVEVTKEDFQDLIKELIDSKKAIIGRTAILKENIKSADKGSANPL